MLRALSFRPVGPSGLPRRRSDWLTNCAGWTKLESCHGDPRARHQDYCRGGPIHSGCAEPKPLRPSPLWLTSQSLSASAYLTAASFASYSFTLDPPPRASPALDDEEAEEDSAYCVFGISLSTVLECLNIFGNATPAGGGKEWMGKGEREGGRGGRRGGEDIEKKDDGKVTSMRMSYSGEGEPLVLL